MDLTVAIDGEASRAALGEMLDRLASRNATIPDDEAMALANEELHAMRDEIRADPSICGS